MLFEWLCCLCGRFVCVFFLFDVVVVFGLVVVVVVPVVLDVVFVFFADTVVCVSH